MFLTARWISQETLRSGVWHPSRVKWALLTQRKWIHMDVGKTVEDVTKKIRTFVAPVIRNPHLLKIMLKNHPKLSHLVLILTFLGWFSNIVMRHFWVILKQCCKQIWENSGDFQTRWSMKKWSMRHFLLIFKQWNSVIKGKMIFF